MGTIETVYAMRELARVMVGSEELEPGQGWNYYDLFRRIAALPRFGPRNVGKAIVESFRAEHQDLSATTLSAIDVSEAVSLAHDISAVSLVLAHNFRLSPHFREMISVARSRSVNYGRGIGFTSPVDLTQFVIQLLDQRPGGKVEEDLQRLLDRLLTGAIIFDNYASFVLKKDFGSYGLSIVFPQNRDDYYLAENEGYLLETCHDPTKHPVDFVCQLQWSCFVLTFVGATPPNTGHCSPDEEEWP
jgi:hypothetical protein